MPAGTHLGQRGAFVGPLRNLGLLQTADGSSLLSSQIPSFRGQLRFELNTFTK